MQGNWNHDKAHYRCRYPSEYAIANKIEHSPTVYFREDQIVGPLDHWLAQIFAPERIERSLATLAEAQPPHSPEVETTRRLLTEQNRRLAIYRQALEAGTDPQLVASWTKQVLDEKRAAESRLAALEQPVLRHSPMSRDEIRSLVESLGGLLSVLRRADPTDKHHVYRQLGLKLSYNDKTRMVVAEATPSVCVKNVSGGGHIRYPQRSGSSVVAAQHTTPALAPHEPQDRFDRGRSDSGCRHDHHTAERSRHPATSAQCPTDRNGSAERLGYCLDHPVPDEVRRCGVDIWPVSPCSGLADHTRRSGTDPRAPVLRCAAPPIPRRRPPARATGSGGGQHELV